MNYSRLVPSRHLGFAERPSAGSMMKHSDNSLPLVLVASLLTPAYSTRLSWRLFMSSSSSRHISSTVKVRVPALRRNARTRRSTSPSVRESLNPLGPDCNPRAPGPAERLKNFRTSLLYYLLPRLLPRCLCASRSRACLRGHAIRFQFDLLFYINVKP